jgi:hypothetical protein
MANLLVPLAIATALLAMPQKSTQTVPLQVPDDWVALKADPTLDDWRCVGLRPRPVVEIVESDVRIAPQPPSPPVDDERPASPPGERGTRVTLRVGASWYLAFNRGEFGGALWLLDASGRYTKLHDGPNSGMVRMGEKIALLSGISHMSRDAGAILLFDPAAALAAPLVVKTKGAPAVAVSDSNGGLTFATRSGVFRLDASLAMKRRAGLAGIFSYPTSIAVKGDAVVLAYRHLVLVIGPAGQQWYVERDCQTLVEDDTVGCSCVPPPR